jgi:hypothetical protein
MDNFEKKVREILFYIRRYAPEKYFTEAEDKTKIDFEKFSILCNDGYKKAQDLLLQELIKNQEERKQLQIKLKNARRENTKEEEKILKEKINTFKYQDDIFRNMAFTMAWLLLNGKREIVARFYTEDHGEKSLSGKGFDAILEKANKINEDSQKVCLILDLTNNLQIGDLLEITPNDFQIIEVKSGSKNDEAKRVLEFNEFNKIDLDEERLTDAFDQKFAKQVLRMHEQNKKRARVKEITENDKGLDPKHDNLTVKLPDSTYTEETYHQVIGELLAKTKEEDVAYATIQDIIHIGVYKNEMRKAGPVTLKHLNNNFPIYDIMSSRGITICEPIFAKPFDEEDIIDIVMKRTKIFIGIDIEGFITVSNDLDLSVRWSSRKELNRLFDKLPLKSREIYSYENKGLVIEPPARNDVKMFVGQGMFIRIIFDHILPHIIIINRAIGINKM